MKKLASILAVTLAAGVLATGCGSSSGSASKDSSSDSGKTVIKAATGANAKPYVYVGDDDKPAGSMLFQIEKSAFPFRTSVLKMPLASIS